MNNKINARQMLPLLLAYFVMGFVDIVGVSTGFVKKDFSLTDDIAQLIPAMAFLWFFLLSIPVSVIQARYGKRVILNIGMLLTGTAMVIPFVFYSFPAMLITFLMLGIGNTIVQVPINPLLHDVVPGEKYSSYMSLSQFIKAISSLAGPIITAWAALQFGDWRLVFAVYAVTSVGAVIWLGNTPIEENKLEVGTVSFASAFRMLKDPFVILLVGGIFLSVGAEVGLNSNIANFINITFNISLEEASFVISYYYTALMIGRFAGALLLNWFKPGIFLFISSMIAVVSLGIFINAPDLVVAKMAIFITGLGSSLEALLFHRLWVLSVSMSVWSGVCIYR
jgi:fucose permease